MSTPRYPVRAQAFQYPPAGSGQGQPESALLQLRWAWRGLYDSFRWNIVFSTVSRHEWLTTTLYSVFFLLSSMNESVSVEFPDTLTAIQLCKTGSPNTSDAEIRANVYKSLLLNTLSLLSIYVFDLLLQPLVQDQQKWFHRNIGWFYQILWLLPVVGVSLYLNGTWCTIIAKRTYLLQHGGRPVAAQPTSYTGMLTALATSAYRVVMVCTSVVVDYALGRVPLVGPVMGFMFLCWVDSYYCFEFVWISRGLSLSKRIRHLEERWAYYFAFGLPSAAVCTWGSSLANAAIFALIFPSYIIMAMHARPVPTDPYNPLPPLSSSSASSPTTERDVDAVRHPSPFIPIRLPVFALVIWINDAIVRVLNVIGGRPIVRHGQAASVSSPGGRATGRGRALSDSAESAEDGMGGQQMEMKAFTRSAVGGGAGGMRGSPSPAPSSVSGSAGKPVRPPSGRVNIGVRRKAD